MSAETSRRMACDASVVHWREGKNGDPLNVGRKTRTIPPAIRRALQRRDGGCRFPGCTCTRFVDAHHIHHWADGGETRMDNLVLLCRNHHRLVHEGGFGVQARPAGDINFTLPSGKLIPQGPETRFRGHAYPVVFGRHKMLCFQMSTPSASIAASGQAWYSLARSVHDVAKTQDVVVPELKRISMSAETL